MKVVINGVVYDPEETQIVITFENDADKAFHTNNLHTMGNQTGPRAYSIAPDELDPKTHKLIMTEAVKLSYPKWYN